MTYFTFAQIREGNAVVRQLCKLARAAMVAPTWIVTGYDEDGEPEVDGNEAPHECFHDAYTAAWEHPVAASILRARGWSQDRSLSYPVFIRAMPDYGVAG